MHIATEVTITWGCNFCPPFLYTLYHIQLPSTTLYVYVFSHNYNVQGRKHAAWWGFPFPSPRPLCMQHWVVYILDVHVTTGCPLQHKLQYGPLSPSFVEVMRLIKFGVCLYRSTFLNHTSSSLNLMLQLLLDGLLKKLLQKRSKHNETKHCDLTSRLRETTHSIKGSAVRVR